MPGFNAREIRVIPVVVEEWNSYIFWILNDVDNLLKKINLFLYGSSPKTCPKTHEESTWLSDTFTFHFHALEKEMATHSSVLAWRIPGMAEPGGLPSMGLHRVGHGWSDLAAAAALHYLNRQRETEDHLPFPYFQYLSIPCPHTLSSETEIIFILVPEEMGINNPNSLSSLVMEGDCEAFQAVFSILVAAILEKCSDHQLGI